MKRMLILGFFCMLMQTFLQAGGRAYAQDQPQQQGSTVKVEDLSTTVTGGYHHYSPKGNRSKVGEYEALDTGAETELEMKGRSGRNYFDLRGYSLDENDLSYMLNIDLSRRLRSELSYTRFQHYLAHDPLSNQDFVQDYNKGQDSRLLIEELKAGNTIWLPQLPWIKFKFDARSYQKRGHEQATTVIKCSQCHITSHNKRVDRSTNDITPGFEVTLGPATITYSHLIRDFTEHASAPMADYGYGASFFQVQGMAPYSKVPDSRMNIDSVALRSALPWASTLYATVQHGKRENRDTDKDITFNSLATRLSKYFSRFLTCDVFYSKYSLENKTHSGIDIDDQRGGFDVNMHPLKNAGLTCSYQWQDMDRDNSDPNSTRKHLYRISWSQRIFNKLRFNVKYLKTHVENPFVRKDTTFNGLVQTSLPQNDDELYASMSWHPLYNLTLNANFRFNNMRSTRYDSDEDRWEYIFNFWYVPVERLTLSGAYTLAVNEVNSFGALKTYHLKDAESLFTYDNIPYDSRSQSWYLSASYRLTSQLSLTGDMTYIDSMADFDKHINGNNVGEYSDLSIGQFETSLGMTYAYNRHLTFYSRYMYRKYNDRENNYLDGHFNVVSIGASWSF